MTPWTCSLSVFVLLSESCQRRFGDFIVTGLPIEFHDVYQLLAQVCWHRALEYRDDDFVARDDDSLNVVGAHDALQRVDHFLQRCR